MRLLLTTGGVFLRLDLDPDASVFDVVISISPSSIHPDAKLAPSNDNEDEILRHVITDTAIYEIRLPTSRDMSKARPGLL